HRRPVHGLGNGLGHRYPRRRRDHLKNGGTGGYRTFIGYSPTTRVGIVALSNTSTGEGVDDIGLHLLDARFPLSVPEGSPSELSLDTQVLDRYVGSYELFAN